MQSENTRIKQILVPFDMQEHVLSISLKSVPTQPKAWWKGDIQ